MQVSVFAGILSTTLIPQLNTMNQEEPLSAFVGTSNRKTWYEKNDIVFFH